jgi:hypothetical protein
LVRKYVKPMGVGVSTVRFRPLVPQYQSQNIDAVAEHEAMLVQDHFR